MPYLPPDLDEPSYRHRSQSYTRDNPPPPGLPMSAERLAWLLWIIGSSPNELARRLDIAPETARQMRSGRRNVPNRVALWLEGLAELHLQYWQPEGWGEHVPQRHRANAESSEGSDPPLPRTPLDQMVGDNPYSAQRASSRRSSLSARSGPSRPSRASGMRRQAGAPPFAP